MRTNATTVGAALAALAACAAWPLALEAQEPAEQQPAVGGVLDVSPLSNLRRARDVFIDARDFSAALTPAQSVVDAQREQHEPQYAADLAALGLIHAELRNTDDALGHLVDAIDLVETAEGSYSPTLVEYYRGLGRAYIKGGAVPGSDREPRAGAAHQSAQLGLVQRRASRRCSTTSRPRISASARRSRRGTHKSSGSTTRSAGSGPPIRA